MRKFVVISVNENPEYLFYVPLVIWAWEKFGWKVILIAKEESSYTNLIWRTQSPDKILFVKNDKYPSAMVAQVARLYAAINRNSDDYIMTSDADMLPLSDYWKFDSDKITVWGHDLTNYNHMPICYIGMKASRWIEVMGITSSSHIELMNRDIELLPNAKSNNPEKLWCLDQDLITERINAVQFEKEFVHRGVYPNGYPIGRIDRSAFSLNHPQYIDCHMPRVLGDHRNKAMLWNVLVKVWPQEDFGWFGEYSEQFSKLVK